MPFECADPQVGRGAAARRSAAPRPRCAWRRPRRARWRCAFREALIIGSDQVASCEGARLDKPGNHENAVRQLALVSGKTALFDTAVALLDGEVREDWPCASVPCRVTFRRLSAEQIERYLRLEQPYDCAGSAKVEGLGIALIARIDTEDPTSLIGLPLIALTELLRGAGLDVLG